MQPIIECVDASEEEITARLIENERETHGDAFDREGAEGEPSKDICEEWLGHDWKLPQPYICEFTMYFIPKKTQRQVGIMSASGQFALHGGKMYRKSYVVAMKETVKEEHHQD